MKDAVFVGGMLIHHSSLHTNNWSRIDFRHSAHWLNRAHDACALLAF
jgi:hypothetical protein